MGKCFSVCFYQRFDGWLPQSHLQNLLGCAGHTQMAHAVSSLWDLIPQVLPLEGLCGVEHLKINLLIEKGRKLKRQYIFQLCCHMLTPAQSKWRLRMWFFNCSASFLGWLCMDSLYFALGWFCMDSLYFAHMNSKETSPGASCNAKSPTLFGSMKISEKDKKLDFRMFQHQRS